MPIVAVVAHARGALGQVVAVAGSSAPNTVGRAKLKVFPVCCVSLGPSHVAGAVVTFACSLGLSCLPGLAQMSI